MMINHSKSDSMDPGPMAGIGTRRLAQEQQMRMREWQQQEQARLAREQRVLREQEQREERLAAERQAHIEQQRQLARQASAKVISDARPSLKTSGSANDVHAPSAAETRRHQGLPTSRSFLDTSAGPSESPVRRAAIDPSSSSSHRSSGQSSASSSGASQMLRWDRSRRPTPRASPDVMISALPDVSTPPAHARDRRLNTTQESHSRNGSDAQLSQRSRYSARSTAQSLPKATCADCGERLPFESLVGHICQAARTPLSPIKLPDDHSRATPQDEAKQSPFFARYAEAYGSTREPEENRATPRAEEQETLQSGDSGAERRRFIEAQRAAKRKQSLGEQTAWAGAGAASLSPGPKSAWQPQHRRNNPGSQSSASTASSKISDGSIFSRTHAETLTPSSSNETFHHHKLGSQTDDEQDVFSTQKNSASKTAELGLDSLESAIDGMLREAPDRLAVRGAPSSKATNSAGRQQRGPRQGKLGSSKLCSVCLVAFERGQPLVAKDGKYFCIDDYAELYLEKCRKCCQPVRNVGVRSRDGALPGLFHRDCFSCLACNARFEDGTFYVFDNAPYCAHDYHRLNGTLCAGCDKGIEGQCRQLTESKEKGSKAVGRFHPRCFTCQYDDGREFCKDALQDYFVVDGKRMCEWHFGKITKARAALSHARRALDRSDDRPPAIAESVAAALRAARRTTFLHTVEPCKATA